MARRTFTILATVNITWRGRRAGMGVGDGGLLSEETRRRFYEGEMCYGKGSDRYCKRVRKMVGRILRENHILHRDSNMKV